MDAAERILEARVQHGLLTIITTIGRRLVLSTETLLGSRDDAIQVAVIDDGSSVQIGSSRLTLSGLRMHCDPVYAEDLRREAERCSLIGP